MKIRQLIAATVATGTALTVALAGPAAAAAPKPYHIKNSSSSNYSLYIFSGTDCNGSMHVLSNGDTAVSLGWDSMRASHAYDDAIYDDKTGELLATRRFAAYQCSANLSDNSHYVLVL